MTKATKQFLNRPALRPIAAIGVAAALGLTVTGSSLAGESDSAENAGAGAADVAAAGGGSGVAELLELRRIARATDIPEIGAIAEAAEDTLAAQRRGDCVTLPAEWTEETMVPHWLGPANPYPVQQYGEALTYFDHIFDGNNEKIGEAVGYVNTVYTDDEDHLFTTYNHTAQLPDGNFTGVGLVDRTEMFQGGDNTFYIRGTTGEYEGMYGTMEWHILEVPPRFETRVNLDITLCG